MKPKTIIGFFVAKAISLGIDQELEAAIQNASSDSERESGINYRIQYLLGEDGSDYLTIYGNGEFDCEFKGKTVSGKLPPPHAKSWIRKLVTAGVAPDFARSHWGDYYGFRHGLRGEP